MSEDLIEQLRAELDSLDGPARMEPLARLGQSLFERYWRVGVGSTAAEPHLNSCIEALAEAYRYLDPDDGVRAHLSGLLGMALATRQTLHGGSNRDRDTAIQHLDEAMAATRIPPVVRSMAQLMLALLSISRLSESLNKSDLVMTMVRGGTSPQLVADADRAVEYCRAAAAAELPAGEEIRAAVRAMVTMAEAIRAMLGSGGPMNLDFGGLMQAMSSMQSLVEEARSGGSAGLGSPAAGMHTVFNAFAVAALDPLDRPLAILHGEAPAARPPVAPRRTSPATAPADPTELRNRLHARFTEYGGGDDAAPDVRGAATALLRPGAASPDQDSVDRLVALASTVCDSSDPADPLTAGTDQFLLAVALYLRERGEDTGDGTGVDHEAGLECLLAAAGTVPAQDPAAITVLRALGAFIDGRRPPHETAAGFVTPIDGVTRSGAVRHEGDFAVLYALHCLCRAAGTVDVRRAVAGVPDDYPWRAHLVAAAEACSPAGADEALA